MLSLKLMVLSSTGTFAVCGHIILQTVADFNLLVGRFTSIIEVLSGSSDLATGMGGVDGAGGP